MLVYVMEAEPFDEVEFFGAIARSGARALLIGRRALVALGLPVLTADYDFWLHPDDMAAFNGALQRLDFVPNRTPEEARSRGRYVLEQDERVDVLVAATMPTVDGHTVRFQDLWSRHLDLELAPQVPIHLPTIEDLIATKKFGSRPKDLEDIRLLEALRRAERP